jgi:transposase
VGQAYPAELRERAVRMVLEHQHEHGSQWEAICSVADKLGPTGEAVRKWVRRPRSMVVVARAARARRVKS